MDRRYLRTEQLLIDAMLDLIHQKPFQAITIEDIVTCAGVARKTFYAHHPNKDELLWASLMTKFEEVVEATSDVDPYTLLMDNKPLSYPVFMHVSEYQLFYTSILAEQGNETLSWKIGDYMAQQSFLKHEPLRELAPRMTVPPELIASTLSGALLGAIRCWLQTGLRETPEQMAYRFSQLLAPGILQSMGLDHNS
ncbi:MAG: TetR/AcrR family transcriptional regulator [Chloroflexi bacterium]|nr:MAG: TetR/AcrR family transcriptional regulator [Chloroflexota bacterium]MBL1196387.1 TetR/AcrR family transcriptional regulator [Chloroflexota bacterium]NOH13682.1 TetR/AcrR family transcriptional regulator [Chloroflexota bacterium]